MRGGIRAEGSRSACFGNSSSVTPRRISPSPSYNRQIQRRSDSRLRAWVHDSRPWVHGLPSLVPCSPFRAFSNTTALPPLCPAPASPITQGCRPPWMAPVPMSLTLYRHGRPRNSLCAILRWRRTSKDHPKSVSYALVPVRLLAKICFYTIVLVYIQFILSAFVIGETRAKHS